jgi:hypothetical protein
VVATVAAVLVPVVFYAGLYRHTGFGMQGRYFLPVAVAIPLLAGELIRRGRDRIGHRPVLPLTVAIAATTAVIHVGSWYLAARRAAVGLDGPLWFAGRSEWSPPLGWSPWAALAVAGAALLVLTPLLARAARRAEAEAP